MAGGFLGNVIPGLVSGLIQTLTYGEQSKQQREDSLAQLDSAMRLSGYQGGVGEGTFNFMRQDYQTPDSFGAMQKLKTDIGNQISNVTGKTTSNIARLNAGTNNLYAANKSEMLGNYDAGSGSLMRGNALSNADLMNRYNTGGAGLISAAQNRGSDVMNAFGAGANNYMSALGGMTGGLNQAAQARQSQGMALLQGMGNQAQKNINQQFDANMGNIGQNLAGRGLGNSTVLGSMLTGNERERANATGNLQDQLRQQALSTYSGLSGDTLNTQQYGVGLQNAAGANILGMRTNLGQSLSGDVLNTQANVFGGQTALDQSLTGQQQQLAQNVFSNRMNLLGGLNSDAINANVSGMTNLTNNLNSGQQQGLAWNQQAGGNIVNAMQNAGTNMFNTITGTTLQAPQSPWGNISNMFQGIGAYQGMRDVMGAQQDANQMAMFNPANYFRGGANYSSAGGLGYNFGLMG